MVPHGRVRDLSEQKRGCSCSQSLRCSCLGCESHGHEWRGALIAGGTARHRRQPPQCRTDSTRYASLRYMNGKLEPCEVVAGHTAGTDSSCRHSRKHSWLKEGPCRVISGTITLLTMYCWPIAPRMACSAAMQAGRACSVVCILFHFSPRLLQGDKPLHIRFNVSHVHYLGVLACCHAPHRVQGASTTAQLPGPSARVPCTQSSQRQSNCTLTT